MLVESFAINASMLHLSRGVGYNSFYDLARASHEDAFISRE